MLYVENVTGQKFSTNGAEQSNDIDSFESCSVVLDKDIVVIDIDEWQDDELLNNIFETFGCRTYYTKTTRGYHLYYRKVKYQKITQKQGISYLGFNIEIKVNQVCEKLNGVANEVFDNDISSYPDVFKTIKSATESLMGLDVGGRDNALYLHSRYLLGLNVNDNLVKQILVFINEHLFNEPLENIEKFTDKEKRKENAKESLIDKTNRFMQKFDTVIFDNSLYCRINDYYTANPRKIKRQIAMEYEDLTVGNVEEVYGQCELRSELIEATQFPINLVGGHLLNGQYYDYIYTGFTPFKLEWSYDPDIPVSDTVEKLLNHLTDGDETYRKLLLQILAYPLIYDFSFKRHHRLISFLVGGGLNGKGTLIELLKSCYGENNISTCTIVDLKDVNNVNTCKNKLINIGDDIEDSAIDTKVMGRLKSISTADTLTTRELYSRGTSSRIACSLFFTSNHILKSFEKGTSWSSRVKWLPAYNQIKEKDIDFVRKLTTTESTMYFLKLLVEVLPDLYENGFVDCEVVNNFNEEYKKINNNVLGFCDEMDEVYDNEDDWLINVSPKDIYQEYDNWCFEVGEKPLSMKTLKETFENRYFVQVKEARYKGRKYRQYVRREK